MRTEGLILQKLDFKDRDKILTLFTPDLGVIKILCKQAKTLSALSKIEVVMNKGKSDLYLAKEFHILDHFLSLRKDYSVLEAAGSMLQTVLSANLIHRPAPPIYALLLSYLKHLPTMEDPKTLAMSFQLKLQRHEGFLHLSPFCSCCQKPTSLYYKGESLCQDHAPKQASRFSEEELNIAQELTYGKSFSKLKKLILTNTQITRFTHISP